MVKISSLFKTKNFYTNNYFQFLENAMKERNVTLVGISDERMDIYSAGANWEVLSMLSAEEELPAEVNLYGTLDDTMLRILLEDEDVRFFSLIVNVGRCLIQFALFREDFCERTKLACMYEDVEELACAIDFFKRNNE